MNRRTFLAALVGLPVAAKLAPALKPTGNLFNPTANVAAQYKAIKFQPWQFEISDFSRQHIIEASLRSIGVLRPGQIPCANLLEDASFRLDALVDSWRTGPLQQHQVDRAIYGLAERMMPVCGMRA